VTAYYNEIDPYAAQWLRNLIAASQIAPGDVDERSIVDVHADDLKGYTQCHFFAGIGGWSLALRIAGWADDRQAWTGSCPCQPFSIAGQGRGKEDDRHLWPAIYRLIRDCRPSVFMGEQVATAIGKGWLDDVHSDLDAIGYQVGAAVLPAESVGAPHRRERIYFISDPIGSNPARRDEDRWRIEVQGKVEGPWNSANWENGPDYSFGVAHGLPYGMAKKCAGGFGNAVVPQVAAEVIGAYMDIAA
jgi:DNA (cytosine-5)-methyltransferase 1